MWLNNLSQLRAGEDCPAITAVPLHRFLCSTQTGQQVWPAQTVRLCKLHLHRAASPVPVCRRDQQQALAGHNPREYAWDPLRDGATGDDSSLLAGDQFHCQDRIRAMQRQFWQFLPRLCIPLLHRLVLAGGQNAGSIRQKQDGRNLASVAFETSANLS